MDLYSITLGLATLAALLIFSLAFHLVTGHRPGSVQGMTAPGFLLEHPSFGVVTALAVVVLLRLRQLAERVSRPAGSRQRPSA